MTWMWLGGWRLCFVSLYMKKIVARIFMKYGTCNIRPFKN